VQAVGLAGGAAADAETGVVVGPPIKLQTVVVDAATLQGAFTCAVDFVVNA
jgi:hypothetical protein